MSEYVLGIDFGTTFTAAAVARDAKVEMVGLSNHAPAMPSAVFLRDDGEFLFGESALRRGTDDPSRVAREFKRRLGDQTPILLGHSPYSADRLMAAVLRQVVTQVEQRYGGPALAVTIAHPANWGAYKIDLLTQAAQLAGVGHAQFVTEPIAAAVHFAASARVDAGNTVAVYDFGGGTFDAAVLQRTAQGFVTLGTPQGIERLGGIDLDDAVMSHVRAAIGGQLPLDSADPALRSALARLRAECVLAKEALSDDTETVIPVVLPGLQTQVRLTRPEFEAMIRPLVRETVDVLRAAIVSAGVTADGLQAIVLAGGSSRIPLVAEAVRAEFGRPVAVDAHPKHTVALGAAMVAAGLASAPETITLPVTPSAPLPTPVFAMPTVGLGGLVPPTTTAAPPAHVAPPPPFVPGPPQPVRGDGASSRRPWLIGAIAAAVVAAVGIGAVVLAGGGDDDGQATVTAPAASIDPEGTTGTTPASTDTTVAATVTPSTATVTVPLTCASPTGRCGFIDEIAVAGDEYLVSYTTIGFEPLIAGDASSHHLHFYFDTVPTDQAGVPGAGPWVVWDLDESGQKLFRGEQAFQPSEVPAGATAICIVVATVGHAVDDAAVPDCKPLP